MTLQQLTSGVDMVRIQRFKELNPAIRARFIQRVYTAAEIKICNNLDERLAGRFAAKEAVSKALGSGIGLVRWQDIEIQADSEEAPMIVLHGAAAAAAEEKGFSLWSVSITHTQEYAMAFVVAGALL